MTETAAAPDVQPIDPAVEAALAASSEARANALLEFARIPSVSAQPEYAGDVARAAEWLAERLRGVGATDVEVVSTALHPIVYATDPRGAGRADGHRLLPLRRPAGRPGRPVGDGAVRALRARRQVRRPGRGRRQGPDRDASGRRGAARRGRAPAVNLTFVFEGEEEYGSESLDAWLEANRDRLGADAVIISDTAYFEGNLPSITIGLRGIMYAQIDVELSPVDLHSGRYGGAVQNPANALATIVAALKGPDGRIRVPGFYDDVVALTDESAPPWPRCRSTRRPTAPRSPWRRSSARPAGRRSSARAPGPTLDVNGIWGGFQGEGAKTIIPAHAHAKVELPAGRGPGPGPRCSRASRLRRGDRAARRQGHGPLPPRRPAVADADRPPGDPGRRPRDRGGVRRRARVHPGGRLDPGHGEFENVLGLPVVLLGFSQPTSNAHAPNEWLASRTSSAAPAMIVAPVGRAGRHPRVRGGSAGTFGGPVRPGGESGPNPVLGCATATVRERGTLTGDDGDGVGAAPRPRLAP